MKPVRSNSNRLPGFVGACVLSCIASSAFAASTWGDLSNGATACGTDVSNTVGNSLNCTAQGANVAEMVKLTAGAFSTTGAGSTFAAASVYNTGTAGDGLGVVSGGGDATPVDNAGTTDAIRMAFTNAAGTLGANFNVTSVTLTHGVGVDADFAVLAYIGAGAPPTTGQTVGGLFSAGWTLVGRYADPANNTPVNISAQSAGIYSSYWLISAYNTGFGGTVAQGFTAGDDVFKVLSVAGGLDPNARFKAPEPDSLALMGIALAGVVAMRRRKQPAA